MRASVVLLALLASAATHADAVDAAPARGLRFAPADELRVVFLDADERALVRQGAYGDATLDVGRMRANRCGGRACMRTVVQRRFRLRVDGGALRSRFVRVVAFIQDDASGQQLRIDGRVVGSAPLLVDAAAPIGVPVAHVLEIEVPVSQPEGVIAQTIVWQVENAQ